MSLQDAGDPFSVEAISILMLAGRLLRFARNDRLYVIPNEVRDLSPLSTGSYLTEESCLSWKRFLTSFEMTIGLGMMKEGERGVRDKLTSDK